MGVVIEKEKLDSGKAYWDSLAAFLADMQFKKMHTSFQTWRIPWANPQRLQEAKLAIRGDPALCHEYRSAHRAVQVAVEQFRPLLRTVMQRLEEGPLPVPLPAWVLSQRNRTQSRDMSCLHRSRYSKALERVTV